MVRFPRNVVTQKIGTLALSVAVIVSIVGCGGNSDGEDGFYSGETITIVVPFSPGGGNDIQSRYMAGQLKEIMDGPSFQVVNQGGAGSVIGTNAFARKADDSGNTLLYTSGSTNLNLLLKAEGVNYKYSDFTPIAIVPSGNVTYISPDTGVSSVGDLADLDEPLVFGAQSTHGLDALNLLAFDLLGLDMDVVVGYEGSGDIDIAFQQGEVDLSVQTTSTFLTSVVPQVEEGEAVPLFTMGQLDKDGAVMRDPVFPDMPHVGEVYEQLHGSPPSGPAWDAYKAMLAAGATYQKILWTYEGTPDDAVSALKDGLAEVVKTQSDTEQYRKALGEYEVQVDDAVQKSIKSDLIDIDPQTQQWILDWLEEKYGSDG